ncbi:MAG: ABC transporter permease subunit [Halobacteriales archaeon]|nr:ABC transporter permease subunit [Halobacteriales archaeon]
MLELFRYGARHRLKGSAAIAVGISLMAALVIWVFPSFQQSIDIDGMLQAYPQPVLKAFGIETMATLEGFLAVELYAFVWVILLGLYTAYAAAGLVSDAVEHDRMDLWLALPVRRWRLLLEQFLTLLVPILVVNVVTPVVVYAGSVLIDDPLPVADLAMVHVLSVPYLLATGAIGLVLGVAFTRSAIAERAALALVFALFLVESLLTDTDLEAVGAVSPTRYYDVNAILIRGQYDLVSAGVLLAATVGLVALAAVLFTRKDVR